MKLRFKPSCLTRIAISLAIAGSFSLLFSAADAGTPDNTAVGAGALNSTGAPNAGIQNTGLGYQALYLNVGGNCNTAAGYQALLRGGGANNTATGFQALSGGPGTNATLGKNNTASGAHALYNNLAGDDNTAEGYEALITNTNGVGNTGVGASALRASKDSYNTAVGWHALPAATGQYNTAIGMQAGGNLVAGNSNLYLGSPPGVAGENNVIRIGFQGTSASQQDRIFVAGIAPIGGGKPVSVLPSGQLVTPAGSSRRFKDEIKPMDKMSESVLGLKPVTFRYKSDEDNTPQFGLVAEEVQKVNRDLVTRDEEGAVYTVRYDAVNAMLLNEFLKEHRKVEEQGATIAKQQKQIDALTAGLQKVSAGISTKKPVAETSESR